MTERFLKPLSFFTLVKEVAVFYVHVFKPIIGIVLLAAIVQALVSLLIPQNQTVGHAVSLIGLIVSIFFYGWILYRADGVLMERAETNKDALHVAKKRFLSLLGVLALYIILFLILFVFGFGMEILGRALHIEFVLAVIALCIMIYLFVLLAFTMPAVVLDRTPIFKSFEYSAKLVWKNWWRTFGVIFIYMLPIVLISLAILLLPTRNLFLLTVYEFIINVITYPLMISLILILYHDLKTRHQKEGFKRISEA